MTTTRAARQSPADKARLIPSPMTLEARTNRTVMFVHTADMTTPADKLTRTMPAGTLVHLDEGSAERGKVLIRLPGTLYFQRVNFLADITPEYDDELDNA